MRVSSFAEYAYCHCYHPLSLSLSLHHTLLLSVSAAYTPAYSGLTPLEHKHMIMQEYITQYSIPYNILYIY